MSAAEVFAAILGGFLVYALLYAFCDWAADVVNQHVADALNETEEAS